jgi:molecular chaperone Hsp33
VHAGASAEAILAHLLGDLGMGRLSRLEPRFLCPCTPERVRRAALLLGSDEIRDIARRGEPLEVRCAFCAEVYHVAADELARG